MDEDNGENQEEGEGDIHCVGEDTGKSYLTQQDYEESLKTQQTEDDLLSDGIFTAEDKNRYNLRSKSNAAQEDASAPPTETTAPVNQKDHASEYQPAKSSKGKAPVLPKKTAIPVDQQTPESQPPVE
jgi:ribonuclease HI